MVLVERCGKKRLGSVILGDCKSAYEENNLGSKFEYVGFDLEIELTLKGKGGLYNL